MIIAAATSPSAVFAGVIGDEQVEMGLQTQLHDVLDSWRGGEQAELVRIEQVRQLHECQLFAAWFKRSGV